MRTIERTTLFRRDFKKLLKSRHSGILDDVFWVIVEELAKDAPPRLRCAIIP
jgi:mRNA-degrading endonuclease YafQ of YafQ-DinJ toxin-antitoxin module